MIELSISDIRRALWPSASAPEGMGERACALTGRIFHETFASLLGSSSETRWQSALDPATLGDTERLLGHVYDRLLGPRLISYRAALAEEGESVWNLWQAARAMSSWLSGLLKQAASDGLLRFDPESQQWTGDDELYAIEQPLQWELRRPDWTAAVRVKGVADAVWRNYQTGHWCVLEFKLGQASPAIDLAQACLYHAMLQSSCKGGNGALAVVSFRPDREEAFFTAQQLGEATERLIDVIAKLAGVEPGVPATQPSRFDHPSRAGASPVPAPVLEEARQTGERIVAVFAQYGVTVRLLSEPVVGPSFVRFTVAPGRGTKVSQITGKSAELQVHLHLDQPPMIGIDGGHVVVDVNRAKPEMVLFDAVEPQLPPGDPKKGSSQILLGVDLQGRLHSVDISKSGCPHILVAGTAGSGKSEWLRTAIAGLLVRNTPSTLELVAIDPKYAAFNDLAGSPFLWRNLGVIHPQEDSVPDLLELLIAEMERRNRLFSQANCDHLEAYLDNGGESLPRIVCFCDEYGDMMADKAAKKEIEPLIARLGAKARSSGIHMVLATQYPKADVVTGQIKANLSGRVCLRVIDAKQSQVVLGQGGAEKLLGNGDLLFLDIGSPMRLQAPFLPKQDRERIFRCHSVNS